MTSLVLLASITSTDGNSSLGRGSCGTSGLPRQAMMRDLGCGWGFKDTVGRAYKMAFLLFCGVGYTITQVSARGVRSSSSDCGNSHLRGGKIKTDRDGGRDGDEESVFRCLGLYLKTS